MGYPVGVGVHPTVALFLLAPCALATNLQQSPEGPSQQCEHDAVQNKAEEIRLRLEEMQGAPEAAAYASQQSREQGQQQRGASAIYRLDGKRSIHNE